MTYGLNEKVFIVGLAILFITVVLGGIFSVQLAGIWLRVKREDRKYEAEQKERDKYDRWKEERKHWIDLVSDQNKRLNEMSDQLVRLTRDYENAKQLMGKVNLKGERND